MNKRRLLKLAEFLETAELPGEFDMSMWSRKWRSDGAPACGTAACALGWATAIPSFRKAGLRLNRQGFPVFERRNQCEAGARFFGITDPESWAIFIPEDQGRLFGKHGRNIVAKRIRKLVESAS